MAKSKLKCVGKWWEMIGDFMTHKPCNESVVEVEDDKAYCKYHTPEAHRQLWAKAALSGQKGKRLY